MSGTNDQEKDDNSASALRLGMRQLASGVCIMTAKDGNVSPEECSLTSPGKPQDSPPSPLAMTVSSVTSVSDGPPSLLVCVNKDSRIGKVIKAGDAFAINILAKEHQEISTACAMPEIGNSRFARGSWINDDKTGLIYLEDAPVVFFCELAEVHEYGTHRVCIGRLTHTYFSPVHRASENDDLDGKADLLLYARGGYHVLSPDEAE